MSERKEMSTETRSLIAAVLCLVVIAGWSLIYKPPQPTPIKPSPAPALPVTPAPKPSATKLEGTRNRRSARSHARRRRGTLDRDRKRSLPRGDFQSRRGGAELAAQEVHRRPQRRRARSIWSTPMPRSRPAVGRFPSCSTIRSRNRP